MNSQNKGKTPFNHYAYGAIMIDVSCFRGIRHQITGISHLLLAVSTQKLSFKATFESAMAQLLGWKKMVRYW